MKTAMLLSFFLVCGLHVLHAQPRALISDYDEVVKSAHAEIDASLKSGYLREMADKYLLKGTYVMDVTLHEKGSVLSVFVQRSDAQDVKMQNLVKDVVRRMLFSFKMPKGKHYKFERTFIFE